MPEPDKDDLADALSRLAAGEAPSSPEGVPSEQLPLTPDQIKRKRPAAPVPAPPAPKTPQNAPAPSLRPNAPGVQPPAPKPKISSPVAPPTTRPKPPKPVRPAAPTRSEAPAAPAPSAAEAVPSNPTDIIDDDDAVNVPAPEPAVFHHRPAPPRPKRVALHARMNFRRTMIPILLTMGVALPACAVWWGMLDEDSPLKLMGLRFPITLTVVGVVFLALAIVNMLQVKAQLAADSPR